MITRRLLSVIPGPVFGGAHNQAIRLYAPLRELGWETVVILPDEPGDGASRIRGSGVPVIQIPMTRLRQTRAVRPLLDSVWDFGPQVLRMGRLMRQTRADVVQVHGIIHLPPVLAARLTRVAIVVQLLDTRAPLWLRRAAMPAICSSADVIMSTGRTVAEGYPGATRLGERLVPYIPPVDLAMFKGGLARRIQARTLLGVPEDAVVVGAVGNRNPQKGFEDLIEVAARLATTIDSLELRIVGGESPAHPNYAPSLAGAARDAGLGSRALMAVPAGHQVADVMAGFDVLVVSSVPLSEGLPTVILEAMACGIPVVTTEVGSVAEVIRHGVNGYVVPTGDVAALTAAVLAVLSDADGAQAMGLAGQEMARGEWTLESSAADHARAYELAIAHRRMRQRLT